MAWKVGDVSTTGNKDTAGRGQRVGTVLCEVEFPKGRQLW